MIEKRAQRKLLKISYEVAACVILYHINTNIMPFLSPCPPPNSAGITNKIHSNQQPTNPVRLINFVISYIITSWLSCYSSFNINNLHEQVFHCITDIKVAHWNGNVQFWDKQHDKWWWLVTAEELNSHSQYRYSMHVIRWSGKQSAIV